MPDHIKNIMNHYGKEKLPFLFVIDFEMQKPLVIPINEAGDHSILYNINGNSNYGPKGKLKKQLEFSKYPPDFEEYSKSFDLVKQELTYGNTYLLNLTFPTKIECNLSLKDIFLHSEAKYKMLFKDKFVVFSPEIFVKIKDGKIFSHPMKGTIDASIPGAKEEIIQNSKELAEHVTIVDLIRNDLSMVAKNVMVDKFRYIDEIITHEKRLLQVSSEISGNMPENYNEKIGDIIFTLLPAGSICGAPKKKTLEIIKRVENYQRSYYTGIFGYFDGVELDSGVMIRYIENARNGLIFKSGGGITVNSDLMKEYQELIDKVYVPII